jgi:hypothetical protein
MPAVLLENIWQDLSEYETLRAEPFVAADAGRPPCLFSVAFGPARLHSALGDSQNNMKSCPYCGEQYSDDAVACAIDGQPLCDPTEARPKPKERAAPRVHCPACGAADDYQPTVELRGSFSWLLFLAGGIPAVVFRNAGRARKVRCNKCEALFNVRTPLSKASLVCFWLVISLVIIALILSVAAFLHAILGH